MNCTGIKSISVALITLLCICGTVPAMAQSDSSRVKDPKFGVSAFVETFYVYDFNRPQGSERQSFLYNHNRHNEFNLNMGLIQFGVEAKAYRGALALHTGTYPMDNYADEPSMLRHIFEAYGGLSLSKDRKLWLDVGIFSSHIGFESAIGPENSTMTRSLLAENSPYYLAGARLEYDASERLSMAVLILNGWQRIQRLPGNSLPSFGTRLTYDFAEKATFNWSTFIGSEQPDSTRRMRYFNNLYVQWALSDDFDLIAGFDVGVEQKSKGSTAYYLWYSPVLIARYVLSDQWAMAARLEYYSDEGRVIIDHPIPGSFATAGYSLNVDYSPAPGVLWRLEGRWLQGDERMFEHPDGLRRDNVFVGTSVCVRFSN